MSVVDTARVRGLYPTLSAGVAQLDAPFATLVPESVIRAVITSLRAAPAQPGSVSPRSRRSEVAAGRVRDAVADLLGAAAGDVMIGPTTGSLISRAVAVLSDDWQLGDEVVLSRCDADTVVQPFLRVAHDRGAVVRWAEFDVETGEIPTWQYQRLINERTRVVTVPLGNAVTGMVPDVASISALAHEYGAITVVDAGIAAPYLGIDLTDAGADLLAVGAPVIGGPTVAALVTRTGVLRDLSRRRGDRGRRGTPGPGTIESLPLPIELLDGFTAAIEHVAGLDDTATGTRRQRLLASVTASGERLGPLYGVLAEGLAALRPVTVLGGPDRALPVAAFTVAGRRPRQVGTFLQQRGVAVWTGASGTSELIRALGADEAGGATYVGLAPYTVRSEVDRFLAAMTELCSQSD